MRLIGTLIKTSTFALAALCGLALLLFAVPASGFSAKSVQTGSMQPAISTGSLVIIQDVSLPSLRVGDVVTYNGKGGHTITHRIVAIEHKNGAPFFTTRGDANSANDPQVAGGRIVGRVALALPFVGYAIDFMRTLPGLLLAIYLPALVVIIGEVRRLSAHYAQFKVFRLPWVTGTLYKPRFKDKFAASAKVAGFCLVVALGAAVPVFALFHTNSVTLADNRINVAVPHILFRRVEFACAHDNTQLVNKLPSILFYNPTTSDINTSGWYLMSSNGQILTFRPNTFFDARDNYDIEPDLQAGVAYAGDFLALFDNHDNLVDAISWGLDTSHLDPSLPTIQDGSVFRRLDLVLDTNTATDWAVSVEACSISE